ncbi:competence protein ComE-like protein [Corynebacterium suranareeae]|uniref:Competence protein ComE-like protein n=1 Tax=Corynebacterium suranareeae TaxID=2506452 RepID=A0A160PSH9_9CORY|nr:ComEC/Rec2 family competence protein [Corynebacterium suranareeae]BAU96684.1 competence protein ComE-like protein [Corynebacterium suranareeae]
MTELRLVPVAAVMWIAVAALIISALHVLALGIIVVAVMVAVAFKHWGQGLVIGAVSLGGVAIAALRMNSAQEFVRPDTWVGTAENIKILDSGDQLISFKVEGFPALIPVFYSGDLSIEKASVIAVSGRESPDSFAGIGDLTISTTDIELLSPATGYSAWVNQVRDGFAQSVETSVGESSRGLIPGMVLGDTRLQGTIESQTYIDTGLSHLSAVSGSNVAIVVSSVVVLSYFLTAGPRTRVAASLSALVIFVSLVGFEPSVLRASVTGIVGLLAIINSSRMEPMHGLCLAVIFLLFYDSNLAVQYGFLLSCAATAGIVVLNPLLYLALGPPLARWRVPDIVVRALAVSIAADLVTIPIIALMARQVSLVSVLANVLVDIAVPPITLLGLVAVLASLLPWPVEYVLLKIIEPFTWWIHQVATWCQQLPNSTVEINAGWLGIAWASVAALWVVVIIHKGFIRTLLICCALFFLFGMWHGRLPEQMDPTHMRFVIISEESEIPDVDKGTELIIVKDPKGSMSQRPIVTSEGVPVLYPYRDGEVSIHIDGTQHAADGRF